jgi:alkylhydroperoxidase family enzyme
MTWLAPLPEGSSQWEQVTALAPEAFDALAELHRATWESNDPVLLDLCRLRMATLLDAPAHTALRGTAAKTAGLSEEKVAALALWPTSPLFSPAERAALALAEQYVLGVASISDEQVGAVLEHVDASHAYGLVLAFWSFESVLRTCLTLDVLPDPAALGLEPAPSSS